MEDFDFVVKKNFMLTKLEMSKMCEHLGKQAWEIVPNSAYERCFNSSISIIISLYNYSRYIYECLDSVCASQINNIPGGIEIIVVDDCSNDSSFNLVYEYLKEKSNIPICLVKKVFNTGLADTRNVGLNIARSPYIFILDADNWIYPNCLSILFEEINSSSYASVYGIINKFDNQTKEYIGLISQWEWDVSELVRGPYIDAMAMFNRDAVIKVGGYSTELMAIGWSGWEDYDLWLKLAQANYSCKLVPQILSAYRVHSQSMINITNQYVVPLAKHFTKKFSSLLNKYSDLDTVFGLSRSGLLHINNQPIPTHQSTDLVEKVQLNQTQAELAQTHSQLQQTQAELAQTHSQLQQTQSKIVAIENSKLWKIRKVLVFIETNLRIGKI
ncbi:family 2 glycosyl transferase [Calothrix sp. NIES-4101]|nr:family 2 glycosyl transferase [Calothrix sp. NIES-4101]